MRFTKLIQILIIIFISLYSYSLFSQGTVCKDFAFLWHGKYIDGEKAYACEYSLPDTLTVVDTLGNPISADVTWTGVSGITELPGWHNSAKVNLSHFGLNDILEITAVFGSHSLTMKISKIVTHSIKDFKNLTKYGYDENNLIAYPTYTTGGYNNLPYKFILSDSFDIVKSDSNPGKAYYAPYFTSVESDFKFNPRRLLKKDTLLIEQSNILLDDTLKSLMYGCSNDPEGVLFSGNKIIKKVDFVFLCDTAGHCPNFAISFNDLLLEANKILNKAGLFLELGKTSYQTPLITFAPPLPDQFDIDFHNRDSIFDDTEQSFFHNYYYTTDTVWENDYLVMIVRDLGKITKDNKEVPVLGRATSYTRLPEIRNSLALDSFEGISGMVLAHELGHAAFAMWHPDGGPVGHELGTARVNDNDSFMYSTVNPFQKVRAYHFMKIHRIQ